MGPSWEDTLRMNKFTDGFIATIIALGTDRIRRRSFMMLLSAVLAAAPLPGRAQQAPPSVVGVLAIGSSGGEHGPAWDAWRKALGQAGFIEGRNFRVEFNWADSASQ